METQQIVVTNIHERGFAFGACIENGQQVFIPPFLNFKYNLKQGQHLNAQLSENTHDNGYTPWQAVNFITEQSIPEVTERRADPEPIVDIGHRDAAVFKAICESSYLTSAEIAEIAGIDTKAAGNSALRLFNAGRIAKADVYNRVGQSRASLTLWAETSSGFTDGDDQ